MKETLFAGIDVSTQGCKIVVIDTAAEKIVHVDYVNYDEHLPHFNTKNGVIQDLDEGCSESDPKMWIEAVDLIFRNLKNYGLLPERILCISVSGQQHGLVALDNKGKLSRPRSKLWNDFSTLEECSILTEKVGGPDVMIREVGNSQKTGYTASKIFHMIRHEPEIYEKSSTLFLVHNYINWYLTGGTKVIEPGDTSGMALWNPKTKKWSKKVIDVIDPGLLNKIPSLRHADKSIGFISEDLVERFGFSPRCMIDAGSGDNMYGAVGTGNVKPGIVTVSLGTSGTACTVLQKPFIDPAGEIASYCDSTGNYLLLVCVSNLANGYNAVLKKFNISHKGFNKIVRKTKPGNGGRLLIPWYTGERTPNLPLASPVYFGFKPEDFSREILCRAVLEGHVMNLYEGFQRMPMKAKEVHLTGGLSQSEAWCETIADMFEAEAVPVEGEGAALGAALHAAWVWNNELKHPVPIDVLTSSFVTLNERHRKKPVKEHVEAFRIQKRLFHALSQRIRGEEGEDPFMLRSQLVRFLKNWH